MIKLFIALITFVASATAQGICQGDMTLQSNTDLAWVVGCKNIEGSLTIESTDLSIIVLPNLESIQSSASSSDDENRTVLRVASNSGLQSIRLPALQIIDGDVLIFDNTALEVFETPNLNGLRGSLLLTANSYDGSTQKSSSGKTRVQVDMSSLQQVEGNLTLTHVESLLLHNLTSVYDLTVTETWLKHLSLPQLKETENTGTISILSNPILDSIDISQLQNVRGNLVIKYCPLWTGFHASDAKSLETVEGSLVIESTLQPKDGSANQNTDVAVKLSSIDIPSLRVVQGAMSISSNEIPSDANMTCDGLQKQYKQSDITKGPFSCKIQGRDSVNDNSSNSQSLSHAIEVWLIVVAIWNLL